MPWDPSNLLAAPSGTASLDERLSLLEQRVQSLRLDANVSKVWLERFTFDAVKLLDPGTITQTLLGSNSVGTAQLIANSITADKIAANAITTDKIAANAITADKIAANAITTDKIAVGAVTATQLADLSVTTAKIVSGAVTGTIIADGAVTTTKVAANAITADKLSVNQLSAISVDAGSITAGTLTGVLIRTAASGARVEMSSSGGLRGIDSGGTTQFQIDPTTGKGIFGGGIATIGSDYIRFNSSNSIDWIVQQSSSRLAMLRGSASVSPFVNLHAESSGTAYGDASIAWDNASLSVVGGGTTSQLLISKSQSPEIQLTRSNQNILTADTSVTRVYGPGSYIGLNITSTSSALTHAGILSFYGDSSMSAVCEPSGGGVQIWVTPSAIQIGTTTSAIGFFSQAAQTRRTVTGSKGGNSALASLLSALSAYGLIIDSTT
jgi:hypothetical protein